MGVAVTAELREVLDQFGVAPAVEVRPQGGGHINASYRVLGYGADRGRDYLLQRLNPVVFVDGAAVLRNTARVSAHLQAAVRRSDLPDRERRAVRLLPALSGEPGVMATDGAWWRLIEFIPGTRMIEALEYPREAREIGAAFGMFHRWLADYAGPPLEITIPDFHDTPRRAAAFEEAVRRNLAGRSGTATREIEFARARRGVAELLAPALDTVPPRVVHNDAKPSNVLLDTESGVGLAVVDLDTVMPGSVLHDVGDLVRSASSTANEDETDLSRARVEPGLFLSMASGFLSAGGPGVLAPVERELFVAAGMVITYEQGIRFLADHLAGDRYYRIGRPGQNLDRARVQFRLLASIEAMRGDLERTITDLTHSLWA